jgi:hypothetical protein
MDWQTRITTNAMTLVEATASAAADIANKFLNMVGSF